MLFRTPTELRFARTFADFLFLNPFRQTEADAFRYELSAIDVRVAEAAKRQPPIESDRPHIVELAQKVDAWLSQLRHRILQGEMIENYEEQRLLESLIMGAAFYRHFESRRPLREASEGDRKVRSFHKLEQELNSWNELPLTLSPFLRDPAHLFAVYFQLRRSFDLICQLVQGTSRPINRLRAEIWHSIFPHELQLYGTLLYDRMQDITTLILGPSGTGKDLVAMGIGLSRYIPFDSRKLQFKEPLNGAFHPINLSAMPLDLIESELFGHCAGAFTGAVKDRDGWLERCKAGHTVFLDEVGELDLSIQVKLLRVLQNREFFRVGETEPRQFKGKVIAATNRDLASEIVAGRFRQDLFYRLCSDVLRTPSLREQLDDTPGDLPHLVRIIAAKCLGERAQPEQIDWLSKLTVSWIESCPELGMSYDWPGNFRELEQCVRNVMVRGEYHPTRIPGPAMYTSTETTSNDHAGSTNRAVEDFLRRVRAADLTYDDLLNHYCSLVFSRADHLTDAASRLQKHRSTIQARIQQELVAKFRGETSSS
ncbi:MAG: sigma-54-dependent Fis family transcriptional regulator [Planctomycetaceae bacterium]|nr:sigma-54-dependent Fis family transcriptional regulator [Planctomycetaceae bacterium]